MDKIKQEQFLEMFKRHRDTFSELKVLQTRLQKGLKKNDSKEIADCMGREAGLLDRLSSEREEIQAFQRQWKELRREKRDLILREGLGTLLDSIETIAVEINQAHTSMFGEVVKVPGSGSSSQAGQGSISDMIHLYR